MPPERERVVGMHQTQDMIGKESPDCQGAAEAECAGSSSRSRRYASVVKVVSVDGGIPGREGRRHVGVGKSEVTKAQPVGPGEGEVGVYPAAVEGGEV